jgi:hypothetical protein
MGPVLLDSLHQDLLTMEAHIGALLDTRHAESSRLSQDTTHLNVAHQSSEGSSKRHLPVPSRYDPQE